MPSAYLPGLAAHEASKLFGGNAKTDERDATVIAKTALGIPDALLPVAHPDPAIAAARSIAAQRDFLICENTRNKNRLRSILLESCPEFEALVDLSDAAELRLMAAPGGPWSMADTGGRKTAALARGANRDKVSELIESAGSSTKPDAAAIAAEDQAARLLARRIVENAAEIEAADDAIAALLERDETYRCLLTIPGMGPKTASKLAISINIDDFPSHDRLASYCGLAPRNRQSGTSISSVSASRQGNKRLEEPAHLLMQLPRPNQWPMGRVLRALPRPRHAARQGAEGRREKETQGDLRGHEGQGSVRRVGRTKEQSGPPGPARARPDFPPKSENRAD